MSSLRDISSYDPFKQIPHQAKASDIRESGANKAQDVHGELYHPDAKTQNTYDKQGKAIEGSRGILILLEGITDPRFALSAEEVTGKRIPAVSETLISIKDKSGNVKIYLVQLQEISDKLHIGIEKVKEACHEGQLSDLIKGRKPKLEHLGQVIDFYRAMQEKYSSGAMHTGQIQPAGLMKIAHMAVPVFFDNSSTDPTAKTFQIKNVKKYPELEDTEIYAQKVGGEIQIFLKKSQEPIAIGGWANIYRIALLGEGRLGVEKRMSHDDVAINEYKALMRLKGQPGVAQAWAMFQIGREDPLFPYYSILVPYAEGGDAEQFLTNLPQDLKDDPDQFRHYQERFSNQVILGIRSLHRNDLAYGGDLKPDNVLVGFTSEQGWCPYLSDFGGAVDLRPGADLGPFISTGELDGPVEIYRRRINDIKDATKDQLIDMISKEKSRLAREIADLNKQLDRLKSSANPREEWLISLKTERIKNLQNEIDNIEDSFDLQKVRVRYNEAVKRIDVRQAAKVIEWNLMEGGFKVSEQARALLAEMKGPWETRPDIEALFQKISDPDFRWFDQ